MRVKLFKEGNYLRAKLVSKKASKWRKLFKGGNYTRADTIQGNTVSYKTIVNTIVLGLLL